MHINGLGVTQIKIIIETDLENIKIKEVGLKELGIMHLVWVIICLVHEVLLEDLQ